ARDLLRRRDGPARGTPRDVRRPDGPRDRLRGRGRLRYPLRVGRNPAPEGCAPMDGHTAIVTGANHGIGAATAVALAGRGGAVLCTFFRIGDPPDSGVPQAYHDHRAAGADGVVAQIRRDGGKALAVEADLSDPATPAALFGAAEDELGPVDILVNNASGWVADTFGAAGADRLGRSLQPVTEATWGQVFRVDAMAPALMIAEVARRHIARAGRWGRVQGARRGGEPGLPGGGPRGAAQGRPGEPRGGGRGRARRVGRPGEGDSPAGHRHGLGQRRGP